jgi:ABC-type multidrug transport system ATPase subunit
VIAVIHQPSQHVFAEFDDLLLVSEGKQMYFGEIASVRNYMETHAYKAPPEMGTAEHILDCISKSELPGETPEDAQERIAKLAEMAANDNVDIGATNGEKMEKYSGGMSGGPRANIFIQVSSSIVLILLLTFAYI